MTENLPDFLALHAKPYDPETDDYRRAPFAEPVKSGKNSAIYNAHSYHTKVPPEGIVPYIKHYTNPGDIVLDPFCGTGMTGVACLMANRIPVLNDLSPAAIHISKNYTTPIDTTALRQEFEKIKLVIQDEFNWLYGTPCDYCGEQANIKYTIWSDVFECGRCQSDIVLWDACVNEETGEITEAIVCSVCSATWRKGKLKWLRSQPVITNCECRKCKRRYERPVSQHEKDIQNTIIEKTIPYWFPENQIDPSLEMSIRCSLPQRGIDKVNKFYTKRNLWGLSRLWYEINQVADPSIQSRLKFIFTGSLQNTSRMYKYRSDRKGGILSGTLFIPSLNCELNVWDAFQRKFRDNLFMQNWKGQFAFCNVGSATDLLGINDNSIDYIFCDPPFGMNIYYSDLNFLWEVWLGEFTQVKQEAVVHREQKENAKSIKNYSDLMVDSFKEMYRVLKPGHWASVVFHNSDDKIWQAILSAAETPGFEISEINAFDKVQLSFKGLKGQKGEERVTNKDIVLNLHKPREHEPSRTTERADQVEAEQRVLETVANFLASNPQHSERSLQHIWNHVLFDMIRTGNVQVSMAMLDEMLSYHYKTFKMVDGKYYLRGEAVVGGNVFDLNTDVGAIAWLNSVLSNESQNTGELIPKWQKETAHLNLNNPGRLDILLEQNFWQEEKSGNWRLPTPAEREKMSAREDLGAQAHLRVIRRFLQGTFDRRPTDLELAAWIRFCYNREFYPEAFALFEHVNQAGLEPEEYKTVKKMSAAAKMKK